MKPKQSKPPEKGFADDVVEDEVGVYYTRATELHGFGSPLGEHEDGYNENKRRRKNREEKRNDNKSYNSGRRQRICG